MATNTLPAEKIALRCPKCGRTGSTPRVDTDYPEAVRLEVLCDNCDDGGGFTESFYYDAAGNHITRDPAEAT